MSLSELNISSSKYKVSGQCKLLRSLQVNGLLQSDITLLIIVVKRMVKFLFQVLAVSIVARS